LQVVNVVKDGCDVDLKAVPFGSLLQRLRVKLHYEDVAESLQQLLIATGQQQLFALGLDHGTSPLAYNGVDCRVLHELGRQLLVRIQVTKLSNVASSGHFAVARYTSEGLALLLGKKEAWTPLPWRAMEGVPEFLRGRGWVRVGGVYSTDSAAGSLDEYLKAYLNRATTDWVAVLLERAAVLAIDRSRPARVKLNSNWLVGQANRRSAAEQDVRRPELVTRKAPPPGV
jgi:hypothetical protein